MALSQDDKAAIADYINTPYSPAGKKGYKQDLRSYIAGLDAEKDIETVPLWKRALDALGPAAKEATLMGPRGVQGVGQAAGAVGRTLAQTSPLGHLGQAAPLGKLFTEGVPNAYRAFVEAQTAPTVGQGLAFREAPVHTLSDTLRRRPPTYERTLLGYTPIPGAMDLGERAMRLLSGQSIGHGAAELGPEQAKPLTEQLVSGLLQMSPSIRAALQKPNIPFRRVQPPDQPALGPSQQMPRPPGPRGQWAMWDIEPPEPQGLRTGTGAIPLPERAGPVAGRTAQTWADLAQVARDSGSFESFQSFVMSTPSVRAMMRQHPKGFMGMRDFYEEALAPPKATARPPAPKAPESSPAAPETPSRALPAHEVEPPVVQTEPRARKPLGDKDLGQTFGIEMEEPKAPPPPPSTPPKFEKTKIGDQALIGDLPAPELRLKGQESTAFKDQKSAAREAEQAAKQESLPTGPEPVVKRQNPNAFKRKGGWEHGQPNLADPDDVRDIVMEAGGIKIGEHLKGELEQIPPWAKNKNGREIPRIAEALLDEFPHLEGGDIKKVEERIIDSLTRWPILREEKAAKAEAMKGAEERAYDPDLMNPEAREIHTDVPPGDVQVDPNEWKVMGTIQRKALVDLMRGIFEDESGALRPGHFSNLIGKLDMWKMGKAMWQFRKQFPFEERVRMANPNSPVIAETERFNVNIADMILHRAKAAWHKGVRNANPETIKDAEQTAVDEWMPYWQAQQQAEQNLAQAKASGNAQAVANASQALLRATQAQKQAASYARRWFPAEVEDAMEYRDRMFRLENRARSWLGLDPIPERQGPYIPRRIDPESRDAVSLGAGPLGARGKGLTTSVGSAGREREFMTMREAERAGLEVEDPRNNILLRDWQGFKLRATRQLFESLEAKGALFRDKARAQAASPTGKVFAVEDAPGGPWFAPTEEEARFLRQNLTESKSGPGQSMVSYANALLRNPNLVNPAPHVVKNMAIKYLLARGPVAPFTLARDWVEYARGANPAMLRDFQEAMPFSAQGRTAEEILHQELRSGPVGEAAKRAMRVVQSVNRPSQKTIFQWADPAMRYSLYKYYRTKGADVYEAGNHAWTDLIRYGTRSDMTDWWKSWPTNFFVPWRYGTFSALVKQAKNHPVRTALLIGAVDYLREVNYRQRGKWVHLPWDYIEAPIAQIVQSKDAADLARNLGSQAVLTYLFGPGGAFAAQQIGDILKDARGTGDYHRLINAFWGISQLYEVLGKDIPDLVKTGDPEIIKDMLGTVLLGEHNALTYQPRRLGPGFGLIPESVLEQLPGMGKSRAVQEAEDEQEAREGRVQKRKEREEEHPRSSIEQKLREAGYIR
jgi:hypothetical protein